MNKETKKNIIIIGMAIIIILLVLRIVMTSKNNEIQQSPKEETIEKIVATEYRIIDIISDDLFVVTNSTDYKYGIMNSKGELLEETKNKRIVVLPDNYYLVINDDSRILKRNNKVVETNPESAKFYQDKTEKNAPYIMLGDKCDECETIKLRDDYRAAHFEKSYDTIGHNKNEEVKYGSIIYNAKTGKIIKEVPGLIRIPQDNDVDYLGIYTNSTYFALTTYYDKDFNNLLPDNYFYSNYECGKNEFAEQVKTINSNQVGYYSLLYNKLLLSTNYEAIYSHNSSQTAFVVIKDGKYILVNDKEETILSGYDYMVHLEDYLVTVKGNEFQIRDKNLNVLDDFTYTLDKTNEEMINVTGGLCESQHPYLFIKDNHNYFYHGRPISIAVSTTNGIKFIEISYIIKEVDSNLDNITNTKEERLNYKYTYKKNDNRIEIYRDNEFVKIADYIINYYEDYNYLLVKYNKEYIIYELK